MALGRTETKPEEEQRSIARRRDYESFSPFSMMRRLSDEMERAFGSTFGLSRGFGDWGNWAPAVDVRKRNGNIEISAELPGMTKDDVKVECTSEGVIIHGEKKQEHEKTESGYVRTERSYGSFYRMIPLPEGANTEQAKAEFKNGVLEIRIPVTEQERKSKSIPISG